MRINTINIYGISSFLIRFKFADAPLGEREGGREGGMLVLVSVGTWPMYRYNIIKNLARKYGCNVIKLEKKKIATNASR